LTDKNTATVTFNEPVKGYAAVLAIGSPVFSDILETSKFVLSNTQDNLETYDYMVTPSEA
jgi:hypothetical protein